MEKITIDHVAKISSVLVKSKNSFYANYANPFYLLDNCYFEKINKEIWIYQPSIFRKEEYNLINVPKSVGNIDGQGFTLLSSYEIKSLEDLGLRILEKREIGPEFFYKTSDFVELKGRKFASFRKKINGVKRMHNLRVLDHYKKDDVKALLEEWALLKDTASMEKNELKSFNSELQSNINAIELLDKISNKSYFVEINGKLAGFRVNVLLNKKLWVAVFQKTNRIYKGLNEFLDHVSASYYKKVEYFTTGGAGRSRGLAESKRRIHPSEEKMLYFVLTQRTH